MDLRKEGISKRLIKKKREVEKQEERNSEPALTVSRVLVMETVRISSDGGDVPALQKKEGGI